MRVKDTFHFSRGQVKKKSRSSSFLCLSLLRNDKETVATQAKRLFKICFLVHAFLVCSSSQTLVLTLVYSEIGSDQHESTFLSNPSFRASMLHWVHLQFCKFKKVDYKDSVKAVEDIGKCYNCREAAWPSGQRVGLAIRRSRVRVPLWPLAGFVLGRPEFKFSATLVNSQLVAFCPLGFLILLCCIWIICF